jgi:hypothetical protein
MTKYSTLINRFGLRYSLNYRFFFFFPTSFIPTRYYYAYSTDIYVFINYFSVAVVFQPDAKQPLAGVLQTLAQKQLVDARAAHKTTTT